MSTKHTITVTEADRRLDLALILLQPQLSRSFVRKLLDAGSIKLNGVVEYRPQLKVKEGDIIELELKGAEGKIKSLPGYDFLVEILYEDDSVVAVNKPSGLKVHPSNSTETETLINALYFQLADRLTAYGISLINRIDQLTSGIVLAAKSADGAWFYSRQFAQSKVHKEYLCVVKGNWFDQYGEGMQKMSNYLDHDSRLGKQFINKQDRGDYAVTEFLPVEYDSQTRATLVQAFPQTGRTHQIRVHLQELGYPIIGDDRYGGIAYDRLLLHAHSLKLEKLPSGDLNITAPIPDGFWPLPKK